MGHNIRGAYVVAFCARQGAHLIAIRINADDDDRV